MIIQAATRILAVILYQYVDNSSECDNVCTNMISIVLTFVTMLVSVIPMQRFAKTGRPVEARHSRAHSHSSTFLKY